MNRRTFVGTIGVASVAIAGTGLQCSRPKSAAGAIAILTGAITDLKGPFPNLGILDKVVSVANSFNDAWKAGKFDSARSFFDNLDELVSTVIKDVETNASTNVKLALAALKIGLRAIAALIDAQGSQSPQIAAQAGAVAPATVSRIKSLANPADADWILKAVQK